MTNDEIKVLLEKLRKARAWCAKEFAKRDKRGLHPSFLANELLKEASAKFELGDYGVEGWCTDVSGKTGVEYLNYGDPYTCTLLVWTRPEGARFHVAEGGWSEVAGEDDTERKVAREKRREDRKLLKQLSEDDA